MAFVLDHSLTSYVTKPVTVSGETLRLTGFQETSLLDRIH